MADRRSQSDESLIVEYFTVQPLAACDALLNQIGDILRKRRPKKVESGNNAKLATEPAERKPAQRRKAGKEVTTGSDGGKNCWKCGLLIDANIHQLPTHPNYHEFVASVEPASEASKGVGA